jgi:hypothetical protein
MFFLDRMNEILEQTYKDPNIAEGNELVICHPERSHGIFLRDGGVVDINSGTQVMGLTPRGLGISVQALDMEAQVASLRCHTFWLTTSPNGWIIDGYVPDYGILHGDLIGRYLRDARVVITRGSLRKLQDGGRSPSETSVCTHCPNLVSVPLSSLIEPRAWSRPAETKTLDRLRGVLDRVRGGGKNA